jgi:hypothetical protein
MVGVGDLRHALPRHSLVLLSLAVGIGRGAPTSILGLVSPGVGGELCYAAGPWPSFRTFLGTAVVVFTSAQ